MGYFKFFYADRTFYHPVPYALKKVTKNLLNFYLFTVINSDSFKNESARTKKTPQPV